MIDLEDKYHQTALHHACLSADANSVRQLIQAGANIEALGYNHWAPLLTAARGLKGYVSYVPCMRQLVEAGCDIHYATEVGWRIILDQFCMVWTLPVIYLKLFETEKSGFYPKFLALF